MIHSLPPAEVALALAAFAAAFRDVFFWTIPIAAVAFVVALFLKDAPLRSDARDYAEGEGMAL